MPGLRVCAAAAAAAATVGSSGRRPRFATCTRQRDLVEVKEVDRE